MPRSCRLLAVLPVLLLLGAPVPGQENDAEQPIANWPAPLLWSASSPPASPAEQQDVFIRLESEASATVPLPLIGITPCRIADTRGNGFTGAYGLPSLGAAVPRSFALTGRCGIAATARAVSLNVTVTNTMGPGFIKIYPQGAAAPVVSTLNYVAGQTVANAAVVPLGTAGGITVVAGVSGTDLIIDTNGYFDNSGVITGVTPGAGLSGGGTSGTVSLGIAAAGVTSTELAANSVTSSKIAANAVTSGAIGAGQVGAMQLASGAVTKGKLSATGGTTGQVLVTDGSGLLWQPQGLALPYSGTASSNSSPALVVTNTYATWGIGIRGEGDFSGAIGKSASVGTWGIVGTGAFGVRTSSGVAGESPSGPGVYGRTTSGDAAIEGENDGNGDGVYGWTWQGAGVHGSSDSSYGVYGFSVNGYGVYGVHGTYQGYLGYSDGGVIGKETVSGNYGYLGMAGYAGYFSGPVQVNGTLTATGTKSFRIDHPLDPENRELWHAAVESSEVLDVYSGNVVTDTNGRALVELPDWFGALNTDFRYQLTVIGQFARAIVEKEIEGNRFGIRTDLPGVKVSWQVTARRNDAWMRAHPFTAEREKSATDRGRYLSPIEHGQPEEKGVHPLDKSAEREYRLRHEAQHGSDCRFVRIGGERAVPPARCEQATGPVR